MNADGRLFQQLGESIGQADTHLSLGSRLAYQDRHDEAIHHTRQAFDLSIAADYRPGQAATCFEISLELRLALGDRHNQASTLTHLGDTHCATGNLAAARKAWRQAREQPRQRRDGPAPPDGSVPASEDGMGARKLNQWLTSRESSAACRIWWMGRLQRWRSRNRWPLLSRRLDPMGGGRPGPRLRCAVRGDVAGE